MAKIYHKITIETPSKTVLEQLSSIDGLKKWWMKQTSGNPSEVGGEIEFGDKKYFNIKMKVSKLEETNTTWEVLECSGPEEHNKLWNGTTIEFSMEEKQLERLNGKTCTVMLFKHMNLPEGSDDSKVYAEMNWHWAYFLLSLKYVCEGKEGMSM